jgi:thiol-disulfide isomerase/thioredoxin
MALLIVGLLTSAVVIADPGKDFDKLEDAMESAFEAYVAALDKRSESEEGKGAPIPDSRPSVLAKMDALAAAHVGKPEGAEMALKTFIWSAMFEVDVAHLFDRFDRIAKYYPKHEGTEEIVAMVPDVFRASGAATEWIGGLNAIAKASEKKSVQVAAFFAAGQLYMQTDKIDDAKKSFQLAAKLDPDSESGEVAKGYVYEIEHLQIGMTAPDFTTTTLDGKKVSLKDLRGKVVLVDFWATWCGPCLGEIPYLKEAAKHFDGKPFEILGVSLDDFEEMLEATLDHHKLPGIHTWEEAGRENEVATLYNAQVLPTWYLIDAKGVIRAKDTFGEALIPAVEKLLKKN